jgi:hypothetical protein
VQPANEHASSHETGQPVMSANGCGFDFRVAGVGGKLVKAEEISGQGAVG